LQTPAIAASATPGFVAELDLLVRHNDARDRPSLDEGIHRRAVSKYDLIGAAAAAHDRLRLCECCEHEHLLRETEEARERSLRASFAGLLSGAECYEMRTGISR
jgi:hypothetical protein